MKIGVLGGTFDPIHWGHLVLAETVRDQEELSEVLFVPTATPPHKPGRRLLDIRHRMEMTQAAIAGAQGFRLSPMEADPAKVSYSIDTLDRLSEQYPVEARLRFIVGADQLEDIATWKDYRRLLEQYGLYVARRSGSPGQTLLQRYGDWIVLVQMPVIKISSTEIRRRVAEGHSIRYLVPESVERYIRQEDLYRETTSRLHGA